MESEAQILLDDAIAFCQRDGQSDRLVNMLSQSTPVELDDESLYIEAPSRFAVAFLEKNRSVVEAYLEEIAFMPISLVVQAPAGSHSGEADHTGSTSGGVAGHVCDGHDGGSSSTSKQCDAGGERCKRGDCRQRGRGGYAPNGGAAHGGRAG